MTDGLAMRYAFLGTLETTHLNAEGFINYCERYCNSMYGVSQTLKPAPKFEGPLVREIAKQLESDIPLNKLQVGGNELISISFVLFKYFLLMIFFTAKQKLEGFVSYKVK